MMFCTVAAEWCITAWGASFAEEAADVSADTAVALMFGYFGGVVAGRATGSRLTRRVNERRLLAGALAVAPRASRCCGRRAALTGSPGWR